MTDSLCLLNISSECPKHVANGFREVEIEIFASPGPCISQDKDSIACRVSYLACLMHGSLLIKGTWQDLQLPGPIVTPTGQR